MLDPEDAAGERQTIRYSFAGDIVELVVLTTDDIFLQTLREAVGASRRLWHVPTADKVSDLLVAGGVGILVLDAQALLAEVLTDFTTEIKRQFPDLVVVVAGTREVEGALAPLISDGAVYRFIHKPLSPGRARIFADVAVKKYIEQRHPGSTRSIAATQVRAHRAHWIYGICAAAGVLITLIVGWMSHRTHEEETAQPSYPGAPAPPWPAAAVPQAAPEADAEDHDQLMARAENALSAQFAKSLEQHRGPGVPAQPKIASVQDGPFPASQDAERIVGKAPELAAQQQPQLQPQSLPVQSQQPQPQPQPQLPQYEGQHSQDSSALDQPPQPAEEHPALDHPVEPAGEAARVNQKADRGVISAKELTLLKSVPPVYPQAAEWAGTEGWVDLEFSVAESGAVKDIAVRSAAPSGVFEQAAMRAISQWRYQPVVQDGKPAPRVRIRIRFTLAR